MNRAVWSLVLLLIFSVLILSNIESVESYSYGYEYVHFSCKSGQICLLYFVALLSGAYIYGYHICFQDLSVYHYVTTLFISDYIPCYEIYSILILYIYFIYLFCFVEKEMATRPSILAWRIPWTEEYSGLQSMGFQQIRHD